MGPRWGRSTDLALPAVASLPRMMRRRPDVARLRSLARFEADRFRRARQYPRADFSIEDRATVTRDLRRDGVAVCRGVVDGSVLDELSSALERHLDTGTRLKRVVDDSARSPVDLGAPAVFLGADELCRGQNHFRGRTNTAAVADPLLTCPAAIDLALHPIVIDIAANYLRCIPAVGGLNLRKSFANGLPEYDTLLFHRDGNSPKFLKFFFYLHDVDLTAGPFSYVRRSHRDRREPQRKKRWTPAEIKAMYGDEAILHLTARAGDMIIADTTGFHRGTKPTAHDRSMLTVYYMVHDEYSGQGPGFSLRCADYDRLSPKQRAAADFLRVVDA